MGNAFGLHQARIELLQARNHLSLAVWPVNGRAFDFFKLTHLVCQLGTFVQER